VTQNDKVYSIQATPPSSGSTCKVLLEADLLQNNFQQNNPVMSPVNCLNVGGMQASCQTTIGPKIGILGTPVIALDGPGNTTGTLYVVAEMQSGNQQSGFTFYHFLHALEITTLAEGYGSEKSQAPVQICGNGCGIYTPTLFSQYHIQRPGLLYVPASLGNNIPHAYVYIGFSMMDGAQGAPPNGMIFGYDATNVTSAVYSFQASQGGTYSSNGGGIWCGGCGLAFGPDGSSKNWIYTVTANGSYDGTSNWGDSFLRLDPNGLALDKTNYFTPFDEQYRWDYLNCTNQGGGDVDFGSGGVMLIPDNELAYAGYGDMAVTGDKEGDLWFMLRNAPGGFGGVLSGCVRTGYQNHNVQSYLTPGANVIHTNVAFWESDSTALPTKPYVYVSPQSPGPNISGYLYQYALCAGSGDQFPICGSTYSARATLAHGSYGITPAISSASPTDANAIVWLIEKTDSNLAQGANAPAILYAFDAVTLGQLYVSSNCTLDNIAPPATKFSVPTVANGYVYLGAQDVSGTLGHETNTGLGRFYIFGPGRTGTC
jgi:hypothetical protein